MYFDIGVFLGYYTDPNNPYIFRDQNPQTTSYYGNTKVAKTRVLPNEFIIIDGEKLYITHNIDSENIDHLYFTIPTDIKGVLWDFHYHFGYDPNFKSPRKSKNGKKIKGAIFFHKTLQDPDNNKKLHTRCYYVNNENINKIENIECIQEVSGNMEGKFPTDSRDFMFIKEIIQRPFFGVHSGGKLKKRKTTTRRATFRRHLRTRTRRRAAQK